MDFSKTTFIKIDSSSPFFAISIGSFDYLNGINVEYSWGFKNSLLNGDCFDFTRIALSGVMRHDDDYFESIPTFYFDFPDKSYSTFGCYFFDNSKEKIKYYCLIAYTASLLQKNVDDLFQVCLPMMRITTKQCVFSIKDNLPFLTLTPYVNSYASYCSTIFSSGIENVCVLPTEKTFYDSFLGKIVTSHLQTQMTTIIESNDIELSNRYFSFLSKFLLPDQASLSSMVVRSSLVPGLFLQCVTNQTSFPFQALWQFNRPYTWVQIDSKRVFQSPNTMIQQQINNEYMNSVLMDPSLSNTMVDEKCHTLLMTYQLSAVNESRWSIEKVKELLSLPHNIRSFCCEQSFSCWITKSLVAIEMVKFFSSKCSAKYLQQDHIRSIGESLEIRDKDEMKILISISSRFDSTIYKKVYSGKKEVLLQMVSAL